MRRQTAINRNTLATLLMLIMALISMNSYAAVEFPQLKLEDSSLVVYNSVQVFDGEVIVETSRFLGFGGTAGSILTDTGSLIDINDIPFTLNLSITETTLNGDSYYHQIDSSFDQKSRSKDQICH